MDPLTIRIGRSPSSETAAGLLFRSTSYSLSPILAVPDGMVRFWAASATLTSLGVSPFDSSAFRSRSTMISRTFPPMGRGTDAP